MKRALFFFSWFFLSCIALLVSACYVVQTPFVKEKVGEKICLIARERGFPLVIDKVEGLLPFSWVFYGVSTQWGEKEILAEKIALRLSLRSFWKKECIITFGKVEQGSIDKIPFSLNFKGKTDLFREGWTRISSFSLESAGLEASGEGRLSHLGEIKSGTFSFQCADLSTFHPEVKGVSLGRAAVGKRFCEIEIHTRDLIVRGHSLAPSTLTLTAEKNKRLWLGEAFLEGGHIDIPLIGKGAFRFDPEARTLSLDALNLDGPSFTIFGKLDLSESLRRFEGSLLAHFEDLTTLRPLAPDSYLKGRFGAKIDLQSFGKFQDIKCQIEVEDFSAFDTHCKGLTIEGNGFDLFGDLRGEFSVEGGDLSYHHVSVHSLNINSNFEPYSSPLSFEVTGNWKEPFAMKGSGQWQKRGSGIFLNLMDFKGLAFKKIFDLREPFSLEYDKAHFKMSNLALDIDQGHLTSRIDLTKGTSLIKINGQDFPLDFLPMPQEHLSLKGYADFSVDLVAWENKVQGSCTLSLKRGELLTQGGELPLTTKGTLQIHLNNRLAQIHGELKGSQDQYFQFCGSLPILYTHFPLKVEIAKELPLFGELTAQGYLEDLFDFINIGAHRLEGWAHGKIFVSKTLDSPSFQGQMTVEDGVYENYYTGTHLKKINASVRAQDKTFSIINLSTVDGKEGIAHATGSLSYDPKAAFPFSIDASLQEFATVSFDTITGKFNGPINISGDFKKGAMARGTLKLSSATMRIPEELLTPLPVLPITFLHPPEHIRRRGVPVPVASPLLLDLGIEVPGKAKIEGRGLTAELQGNLHLTGTYIDIAAKGTLQLVKGEFLFAGKVFDLTQGELIFNDTPDPSAFISLSGECALPDVTVTAVLRGPLSAPKLSFQSSPQLPTSSLLAQILFNKDISEISAVQGIQLAQMVLSLSGSAAPDILEKIRKSLGIDRLTLVSSENDPTKLSLQIGKYLMRGVLLTLSQGTESRNASVEVELRRGMKLQAEMNEDLQGKFSLKWHHHY